MEKTFPLALVTGAVHRVGKAFALSLAQQGYAIALHYHTSTSAALATAEEFRALGVSAFPLQADLADVTQVGNLFAEIDALAQANSLSLRVLVNSAALMPRGDACTLSAAEFDAVMAVNLRAPFLCAQQAFARMTAGGLIVNVSDIAARKAWSAFPIYTVTKAGLESLTKILARSFAPHVRVNAIAPGLIVPSDNLEPEEWQRLVDRVPIKRAAYLEEISAALDFLLKNEYVTGQTIVVDGGYSLL